MRLPPQPRDPTDRASNPVRPKPDRPKPVRPKPVKSRIDQLLVARGLAESRARAQALILAGHVFSGETKLLKPGQVLAADRLGKWKTTFQLSYIITGLIWLTAEHAKKQVAILEWLGNLARPSSEGGWLQPIFLWAAVALTVISGWNYLWGSRYLLRGK